MEPRRNHIPPFVVGMFKVKIQDGRLIQQFQNVVYPSRKAVGGFACQQLCGLTLHRPHLTCLFCRIRRVYYGKMPRENRVYVYVVLISEERRFKLLKNAAIKVLATLIEALAN